MEEIVDLISKEEYLENEEKIEKALAKSKEKREQEQQEKLQNKEASTTDDESIKKADDKKHILDAEKTPTLEPKVNKFFFISYKLFN